MKGLIVKLTGGLYTVKDASNNFYNCKARGKFRHIGLSPKVGDNVEFLEDELLITEVLERKNSLVRPPVSNIDQNLLVFSCVEPDFNFNLLDRLLSLSEYNNINPVIIVTKTDLMKSEELIDLKSKLTYYENYYDIYYTSSHKNENIEIVKSLLDGKVSVLSGQSGVGKSSLINAINPNFNLQVNKISKALGRGKHTTRHSELHIVGNGLLADTPGFSSLEFFDMELEDLEESFVDFNKLRQDCKFSTCMHINEPNCKVKALLENNEILKSRYDNYKIFYEEVKSVESYNKKNNKYVR